MARSKLSQVHLLRVTLLSALTACSVRSADGGTAGEGETQAEAEAEAEAEASAEGPMCAETCESPETLADGVVRCSDGSVNRVAAGSFDSTITAPSCSGTEDQTSCMTDLDCAEGGQQGKCVSGSYFDEFSGETVTTCGCAYSCADDTECGEGEVCLPPEAVEGSSDWPRCYPAECTTNADCGECGECGIGSYDDGCGTSRRLACRTDADTCRADEECEGGDCFPDFSSAGEWICQTPNCDIGRPLLVDDRARRAPARPRSDWRAPLGFRPAPDAELAAHWSDIAALEHASVASFARFASQLLALGAPPALLRASAAAAHDEVEHAKLTYALASAYAGRAVGPGRLALDGVEVAASWREVVAALIAEACVGETLGVAEAMAAAQDVEEPRLQAILERIAADELRHAKLAWTALDWLLAKAEPAEREWALAQLDAAIAGHQLPCGGLDRPAAGVLGGSRRAAVHAEVLREVLGPLARCLRGGVEQRVSQS